MLTRNYYGHQFGVKWISFLQVQVQVKRYFRAKRHSKNSGPQRKSIARALKQTSPTLDSKLNLETTLREEVNQTEVIVGGYRSPGAHFTTVGVGDGDGKGSADPFFEQWDEAELSSHNNVVIELVEIPHTLTTTSEKAYLDKSSTSGTNYCEGNSKEARSKFLMDYNNQENHKVSARGEVKENNMSDKMEKQLNVTDDSSEKIFRVDDETEVESDFE